MANIGTPPRVPAHDDHTDASFRRALPKTVNAAGIDSSPAPRAGGKILTSPRERPILFSAPMVRALLDGSKTQTRRVGKIQNPDYTELGVQYIGHQTKGHEALATHRAYPDRGTARHAICACPYGIPGDRLWVRESWNVAGLFWNMKPSMTLAAAKSAWRYAADDQTGWQHGWRPSIHMPRWASRIALEIVNIRAERLQDITEASAIAEGVEQMAIGRESTGLWLDYSSSLYAFTSARDSYRSLWESINGDGAWAQNPWVWVIEFRRVEA